MLLKVMLYNGAYHTESQVWKYLGESAVRILPRRMLYDSSILY
jgi:hypothetical protein